MSIEKITGIPHDERGMPDEEMVKAMGPQSHEQWRSGWKAEHGDEPRPKKTTDAAWTKRHGGAVEVDIANFSYDELPTDWQENVDKSSRAALLEVERAVRDGRSLEDPTFIEAASAVVHSFWLSRNAAGATAEQLEAYAKLSEPEKEKDRVIVRLAIKLWQEGIDRK
jgi:hypothetical protein